MLPTGWRAQSTYAPIEQMGSGSVICGFTPDARVLAVSKNAKSDARRASNAGTPRVGINQLPTVSWARSVAPYCAAAADPRHSAPPGLVQ